MEDVVVAQKAMLVEFGLLVPAEEKAAQVMGDLAQEFADGKITAEEYAERLGRVKSVMDSIESKTVDLTINTRYNTYGDPAQSAGGPQGFVDPGTGSAFASGGVSRGGMALVGERGPEMVRLPQGAQVSSAPVTNNYYNTINTRATSGTYAQDMMQVQVRSRGRR
jgi:hypothetical protein